MLNLKLTFNKIINCLTAFSKMQEITCSKSTINQAKPSKQLTVQKQRYKN